MWSRELSLNWSMVRIGLRPANFLRRKIVLSHSLMNFQFCDQLYGIWFQMSCDFSIFKPWQGDIIKHKKDLNDIYNHKSLGFSLFHVLQLLANTFLNSFLCKKFLKKFLTCWCFCQIAFQLFNKHIFFSLFQLFKKHYFFFLLGWICKMLRIDRCRHQRDICRKNCSKVSTCKTASERQGLITCSSVLYLIINLKSVACFWN